MTASTAVTGTAPAVAQPPARGGLAWAFHEGFAAYVARLADGRIDADGGAGLLADGRLAFPRAVASSGTPTPDLRFRGAVHFTGHHGMLALTLADPAIEAGSVLTIDDPFEPGARLVLAELGDADRSGATPRYPLPRLTETGADLFLGHYREGTPLAPLEVLPAGPTAHPAPAPTSDQDA